MISLLLNAVGASCKRKDFLRESHKEKIRKKLMMVNVRPEKG